jgi:hypothetical protein
MYVCMYIWMVMVMIIKVLDHMQAFTAVAISKLEQMGSVTHTAVYLSNNERCCVILCT